MWPTRNKESDLKDCKQQRRILVVLHNNMGQSCPSFPIQQSNMALSFPFFLFYYEMKKIHYFSDHLFWLWLGGKQKLRLAQAVGTEKKRVLQVFLVVWKKFLAPLHHPTIEKNRVNENSRCVRLRNIHTQRAHSTSWWCVMVDANQRKLPLTNKKKKKKNKEKFLGKEIRQDFNKFSVKRRRKRGFVFFSLRNQVKPWLRAMIHTRRHTRIERR